MGEQLRGVGGLLMAPKSCERCGKTSPVLAYVRIAMGERRSAVWSCRSCVKGRQR